MTAIELVREGTSPSDSNGRVSAQTVIDDAQRIEALLQALSANSARAIVRSASDPRTPERSACLGPGRRIWLELGSSGAAPQPPLEVEVSGIYADYRFVLPRLTDARGVMPLPASIVRYRRRRERRVACPQGVRIQFAHPTDPGRCVERVVREVSYSGASFTTDPHADGLHPQMQLDDVRIAWKRGPSLRLRGCVRHVSPGAHAGSYTCGMSLGLEGSAARQTWCTELDNLLYPDTTLFGVPPEAVWDVYAASGYFGLSSKDAAEFEPLRPAFARASARLAAAPELGCQVNLTKRGRVEVSISLLKAWQHAWIVYQLARYQRERPLAASSNEALREVYLHGYEHASRDPDLRWHVGYVQDSAHFSKLIHYDFPRRYEGTGLACIVPMRVWEGRCGAAMPFTPAGSADIGPANDAEVAQLLEHIAATRPAAYVDANDYVPERFHLRGLALSYAALGLRRQRQVLVARRGGAITAAAILEYAEEGLHLFNLLDAVRCFALRSDGRGDFAPLLHAARRWYTDNGKHKFIFFAENDQSAVARAAGLTDLGGASVTILAAELVPDMLEHVCEVTAPRGD